MTTASLRLIKLAVVNLLAARRFPRHVSDSSIMFPDGLCGGSATPEEVVGAAAMTVSSDSGAFAPIIEKGAGSDKSGSGGGCCYRQVPEDECPLIQNDPLTAK